jgi:hypothetical protein
MERGPGGEGLYTNKIPTGIFNVILGGSDNTLTGNYNAILGGDNNHDGGYNCVGIYGFGITANYDCTFYAPNFNVSNMPGTSTLTPGQLYYTTLSGRAVFIV